MGAARRAGRAGRGERGRVGARVRELLAPEERELLAPEERELLAPAEPASSTGWTSRQAPERGGRTGHRAQGPLARFATRIPALERGGSGLRGAVAVGAVVLLAGVVTLLWVLSARPRAVPAAPVIDSPAASTPVASAPAAAASARGSASTMLVVDVTGKVRRPGLYRLPPGARVDDAVRAAGGALPGVSLASVNLAAKVADGQQVAIGMAGAAQAAGGSTSGGAAGAAAGPVSLNSASLEQLQTLPGVGPVLAQHILDWRTAHGSFTSVEQLNEVPGIGTTKFAALRPLVSP